MAAGQAVQKLRRPQQFLLGELRERLDGLLVPGSFVGRQKLAACFRQGELGGTAIRLDFLPLEQPPAHQLVHRLAGAGVADTHELGDVTDGGALVGVFYQVENLQFGER